PSVERTRIRAVLNMDMIGGRNTAEAGVLVEGKEVSQDVIDALARAAATYTDLVVTTSLNPFASDHVPFIDAGIPAVLSIEGADSANGHIHSANDTLNFLNWPLAAEILRMNIAAVGGCRTTPPSGPARPCPAVSTPRPWSPAPDQQVRWSHGAPAGWMSSRSA